MKTFILVCSLIFLLGCEQAPTPQADMQCYAMHDVVVQETLTHPYKIEKICNLWK